MRERAAFSKEIHELLDLQGRAGSFSRHPVVKRQYEFKAEWQKNEGGFEEGKLTSVDQDEKKLIVVHALRFKGSTDEVAIVFAGVHGSEPEGVTAAKRLCDELKSAAKSGKSPRFTTIVIPALIQRHYRKNPRYIMVSNKLVEPNRNFPRPGEGYEYVRRRGQRRKDRVELLDCNNSPPEHRNVISRMLAETRILLQLIEQERPLRAASIHAHSVPGKRGDGSGIFVNPRGGFDEHSDQAFTQEGKQDDRLASAMLARAIQSIQIKLPLKDDGKTRIIPHPFHGNLADEITNKVPTSPSQTIHYTSTKHPPGTSFGMWAPVPEQSGIRKGSTTITVEIPRYDDKVASKAKGDVIAAHVATLLHEFLGVL